MAYKFRPLRADEIEVRVNTVSEKGCSLLLYKDARADMNILDEAVGAENWQRKHEIINGNLYCNIGIRVEHSDGIFEWIWKQDVGVESYTEKEKGQASDAFKRAAVNWGIGRELYTSPFIWIPSDKVTIKPKEGGGKFTTYDRFAVRTIEYKDGSIAKLVIVNASRKGAFAYATGKYDEDEESDRLADIVALREIITEQEVAVLKAMMERKGVKGETYNKTPLSELTGAEYAKAMKQLGAMKDVK